MSIVLYSCGCIPEADVFCKAAAGRVLEEENAASELSVVEDEKVCRALEEQERSARKWVIEHLGEQTKRGAYRLLYPSPEYTCSDCGLTWLPKGEWFDDEFEGREFVPHDDTCPACGAGNTYQSRGPREEKP